MKNIYLITLFFFLLLQAYGLYYYELRMQFEGSSFLFWSATGYHTPMFRYAFILNKFLVFPCFWLHLPLKTIALVFCLNDALFYTGISLLIIWCCKRYDYAAAVLAAPLLIHGINFYFIVNELFLSGSVIVLYVACYHYLPKSIFKQVVLYVSLLLIIWSHPLMLLVLFIFLAGMYTSAEQLKTDKVLLLFVALNIALRLFLLTAYDYEKINYLNTLSLKNYDWWHALKDYSTNYWYIVLALGAIGYTVLTNVSRLSPYKGLLLVPVLLFFCGIQHFTVSNMLFAKYLYPVHLFIVVAAFVGVSHLGAAHLKWVLPVLVFSLSAGAYHIIAQNHTTLSKRAGLIVEMNNQCAAENPHQSKWYVRKEVMDSLVSFPFAPLACTWYTEPLIFSALRQDTSTIQLLWATPQQLREIEATPANKLLLVCGTQLSIQPFFPTGYFHIKKGRYQEFVLNTARVNKLKQLAFVNR